MAMAQDKGASFQAQGRRSVTDDIIVTAQKREERLQDVPVPVSSINAQGLTAKSQFRLQDYFSQVPGLSLTPTGFGDGSTGIAIRGITSDLLGNPTVGIMVDDVPFGTSIAIGGGFMTPDLDPSDLERIEVLRGPQGTLYGTASMGGLLKYVTVSPSLDGFKGSIRAGLSTIDQGSDLGYNLNGSVNIPLNDTLAVRASASYRFNPGFVDNIETGDTDVDKTRVYGGLFSVLWKPSSSFSVKLSALLQRSRQFGSPYLLRSLDFSDPRQSFIANAGSLRRKTNAFSATINTDVGGFDVTSITSYAHNTGYMSYDYTMFIEELIPIVFPDVSNPEARSDVVSSLRKFSQEVRLRKNISDNIEWLVGGFFTRDSIPSSERRLSVSPQGQNQGLFAEYTQKAIYRELAGFTDVTVRFGDRFDVQVGGRVSRMKQTLDGGVAGPYFPIFEPDALGAEQFVKYNQTQTTYLFTPRFKINPDFMLYARAASGYRPGGANSRSAQGLDGGAVPAGFKSDTTQNYEIGLKGDLLGRQLSFDVSAYYIDWKDIQVSVLAPGSAIAYYDNGGAARSKGFEVSLQLRPSAGLRLGSWLSYNDARLTENFPTDSAVVARKGDRLPSGSKVSANGTIDYSTALSPDFDASIGATVTYVGRRLGSFGATPEREVYNSYTQVDLRAGINHGPWSLNVYANNLTNNRAVIGGGIATLYSEYLNIIPPRTVGMSLTKAF
jgi:outer membrane receptor protein involved in Fe transport